MVSRTLTSKPVTQVLWPPPVLCIYAVSCRLILPKSYDIQIGCHARLYSAVGRDEWAHMLKRLWFYSTGLHQCFNFNYIVLYEYK